MGGLQFFFKCQSQEAKTKDSNQTYNPNASISFEN